MISDSKQETVTITDSGKRLDKFLSERIGNLSRTQIKKSFEAGFVMLNGSPAKPKSIIQTGDSVSYCLSIPDQPKLTPMAIPLNVLYEDDDIIIINKEVGIVVHAGNGTTGPTLVEGVLNHCSLSPLGGPLRPGVVHRLDKDTSGAIIFAKSDRAYLRMIEMFSKRCINKTYRTIVCGTFDKNFGELNTPIGRDRNNRTKMTVTSRGREALTKWQLLENFGNLFAHLSVRIFTGRTHQIRVHLASIRHPIVGDRTYGYPLNFSNIISPQRPMLHAHLLTFPHPIKNNILSIEAPIPQDFLDLIKILKKNFPKNEI